MPDATACEACHKLTRARADSLARHLLLMLLHRRTVEVLCHVAELVVAELLTVERLGSLKLIKIWLEPVLLWVEEASTFLHLLRDNWLDHLEHRLRDETDEVDLANELGVADLVSHLHHEHGLG